MKIYQLLAKKLPAKLVYYAGIRILAETTVGEWGKTIVPELTVMEALDRFSRKHKV